MNSMESFASAYPNALLYYRRRLRLQMQDVAVMVGCYKSSVVGTWERGTKCPCLDNALALSTALGRPVEILYLECFKVIRTDVRKRIAKIPAKRYAGIASFAIVDDQPVISSSKTRRNGSDSACVTA